ncbi:MAG: flavodoxin family protein [Candidatus Zixiibacteriota bacterium]|nr:MAG: flavodoxin family protein [candidate division Zixibacteria bacterium]
MSTIFDDLAACDCLLFGSPLYFDNVSAQAKLFMDRCNCFRPVDFAGTNPEHHFIKRITRKRPGAMVFVGGEGGWYEGARRSVAGWFKWLEVVNEGMLIFHSQDDNRKGEVAENEQVLTEARELGRHLAGKLVTDYAG